MCKVHTGTIWQGLHPWSCVGLTQPVTSRKASKVDISRFLEVYALEPVLSEKLEKKRDCLCFSFLYFTALWLLEAKGPVFDPGRGSSFFFYTRATQLFIAPTLIYRSCL
jgi:hypothetical protein